MAEWCSQTEVEDLLSANGVWASVNDDNGNAIADPTIVSNAIARGRTILGQYLVQRYNLDSITSNVEWVKWAAATFAAVELLRRKGGVVPPGIQELYEQYVVFLKEVQSGTFQVPGLYFNSSPGIAVSNLTMDNRYNRAKVRVVSTISWPMGLSKLSQFKDRLDFGNTY
jgi:hypothetical protein